MSLSPEDRARLVELARAAVAAQVRGQAPPAPPSMEGVFAERRGCFVTLTNKGMLRGCIGMFTPEKPLGKLIVEMGQAAAQDSRFYHNPITPGELPQLDVEVSILSPLQKTDHPEKLRLGVDGIYIVGYGRAGCFLPEVATEIGGDAEMFLSYCCQSKAGLPADAWRDPDVTVYLFTSEKFGR